MGYLLPQVTHFFWLIAAAYGIICDGIRGAEIGLVSMAAHTEVL